jgi:hypothetical protein
MKERFALFNVAFVVAILVASHGMYFFMIDAAIWKSIVGILPACLYVISLVVFGMRSCIEMGIAAIMAAVLTVMVVDMVDAIARSHHKNSSKHAA